MLHAGYFGIFDSRTFQVYLKKTSPFFSAPMIAFCGMVIQAITTAVLFYDKQPEFLIRLFRLGL